MVKTIGNVQKDAQVRAVASGTLSNGDTIIVNSDGTVSAVSGTSASEELGSAVNYNAANSNDSVSVYDANAGKIVVAYRNESNSYIYSNVGTVSGTSISFGTTVVVSSEIIAETAITYDANAQKVVVFYEKGYGSGELMSKVGTVSGTSISYGSATAVTSGSIITVNATYDANAQKVVVFYADNNNGNYPTARVGTISGTSISYGTAATTSSAAADSCFITYDSNAQKVVVGWQDQGNSNYGTAAVGTVSGTSISFGSNVVFQSANTQQGSITFDSTNNKVVISYQDGSINDTFGIVGTVSGTSISFGTRGLITTSSIGLSYIIYDSNAQRVVVTYRDFGNSSYGTYAVGTVSGTSITFETPVAFQASTVQFPSLAFDSSNNKVVISYIVQSTSGTSKVLQVGYSNTNLTSDNFIGFADGAYADTQSAVINTTCSVDRNQTSLTAGQKYYVQTDGSLGLTPADPSVEAGTAISSTEILVKG